MSKSKSPKTEETPEDAGTKLIEQMNMAQDVPEVEESAAPVVETPPEPEKPKHAKWLVNQAKRSGIEAEELAEMSKDEILEAIAVNNQRDREFRAGERPRDDSGRFVKHEPAEPVTPPPEPELKDIGIDLSEFDDETAARLNKALRPLAKQVKELESRLAKADQRDAHREANAHADRLDQLFLENTDVFGKGTRHRMNKNSDEYSLRMMVISEMSRLNQADPSLSFDECFDKASSVIKKFATPKVETPKTEPTPVATTNGVHKEELINRFKNGTTAVPANRSTTKPPKGIKAAEDAVKEKLASFHDELDDELEGLPDHRNR